MKWISVKEKPPEVQGNYIVYFGDYNKQVEVEYFEFVNSWLLAGITHWMPLPEPPEVDNG